MNCLGESRRQGNDSVGARIDGRFDAPGHTSADPPEYAVRLDDNFIRPWALKIDHQRHSCRQVAKPRIGIKRKMRVDQIDPILKRLSSACPYSTPATNERGARPSE